MLGVSHLLISGIATSLLMSTSSPTVIAVGAIAGLLPDVDISTSPAGKLLPFISDFFEKRMPHRGCTHSLLASGIVSAFSYGMTLLFPHFANLCLALSIGYFFGWFADCFSRAGVQMFYPSKVKFVCPGNRNLRLQTGGDGEYVVLIMLVALALATFNINNSGGLFTLFNRFIGSPSGVQQIYNASGSTHLITANIKGVRTSDRARVKDDYTIIQMQGSGFLVQSSDGKIYKASTEPDAQIYTEAITATVGQAAITNIEALTLDDESIEAALSPFQRASTSVYVSGQLAVTDFDSSSVKSDPYQFPVIKATTTSITLEAAPLSMVMENLGEEFATGQLQIRIINATQAFTNSNPPT
jgi:inner membrane protein